MLCALYLSDVKLRSFVAALLRKNIRRGSPEQCIGNTIIHPKTKLHMSGSCSMHGVGDTYL